MYVRSLTHRIHNAMLTRGSVDPSPIPTRVRTNPSLILSLPAKPCLSYRDRPEAKSPAERISVTPPPYRVKHKEGCI